MCALNYIKYINRLFYKSGQQGIPLSGTFELTSRCNLRCRMCYIHRQENDAAVQQRELSAEQWLALAQDAKQHGMLLLLLTGGEPFLRLDFERIYRGCHDMGLVVSINSNGTMIDADAVDLLTHVPPQRVNITLYGSSEETYERLCLSAQAYHNAYRAVEALTAANIPVKLNYSVTPYNADDLPAVSAYATERGLPLQAATYMFPPVRAEELSDCSAEARLSPEQSALARWTHECNTLSPEVLHHRAQAIVRNTEIPPMQTECQDLPTEQIRCRAGLASFWVTFDGQLRPCGMMQTPSFALAEHSFAQAWKAIRKARQSILVPAACTACRFQGICEACPAVCYAENGQFTEKPSYMCRKMDAYVALASAWYMEHNKEPRKEVHP